jgi:hypothetical protein
VVVAPLKSICVIRVIRGRSESLRLRRPTSALWSAVEYPAVAAERTVRRRPLANDLKRRQAGALQKVSRWWLPGACRS